MNQPTPILYLDHGAYYTTCGLARDTYPSIAALWSDDATIFACLVIAPDGAYEKCQNCLTAVEE